MDAFGASTVRIGRDGTILANGAPYMGPLLVQEYADTAELSGATLVQRTPNTSLWRPHGTPRLVTLTTPLFYDGWLGWPAAVTVWPRSEGPRVGTLCLTLGMPSDGSTIIDLRAPGYRRAVRLNPGTEAVCRAFPSTCTAPWKLEIKARRPLVLNGGRLVTAISSRPRFITGKGRGRRLPIEGT